MGKNTSDSRDIAQIDSAFQLTEHLKALHYSHTHPADTNSIAPVSVELARQLSQPPPNTAKEIWLYELARFLIQKTNAIIVHLFADAPPCSPTTCPEMRASEWQYLCAVHDPPKSCSAIDYCCHTLDWAATSLTSSKMFPSRLGLGSGNAAGGSDKVLQQQMKEITNIFRRVYRIYAHAWFQHRDMFWRVEESTGLYIFFKTVCDEYGMIQSENYTIPPEAEGRPPNPEDDVQERHSPPIILQSEPESTGERNPLSQPAGNHVVSLGDTTKRHTRVPSNVAMPVSTVIQEEAEEEEETQMEASSDPHGVTTIPEALPEVEENSLENSEADVREDNVKEKEFGEEGNAKGEETKKGLLEAQEDAKDDVLPTPVPTIATVAPAESSLEAGEVASLPQGNEEDAEDATVLMGEPELIPDEPGVEVTVEAVVNTEPSDNTEVNITSLDGEQAGKGVED